MLTPFAANTGTSALRPPSVAADILPCIGTETPLRRRLDSLARLATATLIKVPGLRRRLLAGPLQQVARLRLGPASLELATKGVPLPLSPALRPRLLPCVYETVARGRQLLVFAATLRPRLPASIIA